MTWSVMDEMRLPVLSVKVLQMNTVHAGEDGELLVRTLNVRQGSRTRTFSEIKITRAISVR